MLTICSCDSGYHLVTCPFYHRLTLPELPLLGWICPKCQAGVSPHLNVCPCKVNSIQVEVVWNQRPQIICNAAENATSNDVSFS